MASLDFERLVEEYYMPLYRFALSLSRKESDAADLTQQTFFLWASKGHQLRDASKVKTWLFTSLYREFLGRKRQQDRFVDAESTAEAIGAQAIPASVVNQLDGDIVQRALLDLDEDLPRSAHAFLSAAAFLQRDRGNARGPDRDRHVAHLARERAVAQSVGGERRPNAKTNQEDAPMDEQEARLILQGYRPGGQDQSDPHFSEALQEVMRNPELAQWFADEQAFDQAIATHLERDAGAVWIEDAHPRKRRGADPSPGHRVGLVGLADGRRASFSMRAGR